MTRRMSWLRFEIERFLPEVFKGLIVLAILGSLFLLWMVSALPASDPPTLLSGTVLKTHSLFTEGPTLQNATVVLSDGSTVVVRVAEAAKPVMPGDVVQVTKQYNRIGGYDLRINSKPD